MPDDDQAGERFSYESALWHIGAQDGYVRDIRVRLGVAISINSLATALFAVARAAWIRDPGAAIDALSIVILVIFVLGTAGAFAALWHRLTAPDAGPRAIYAAGQEINEAAARDIATQAMIKAYEDNEPLHARMELALRVVLVSTAINAALAPATIIAALLS